eukprot:1157208-Pelagomonas_calceolata.AAC.6
MEAGEVWKLCGRCGGSWTCSDMCFAMHVTVRVTVQAVCAVDATLHCTHVKLHAIALLICSQPLGLGLWRKAEKSTSCQLI